MTTYKRIFGTGPRGLFISTILLAAAVYVERYWGMGQITENDYLRYSLFSVFFAITGFIITWGTISLPPSQRGKNLVTVGAYKYFRHPYYGAFLTFFNIGLAVFLNHWIYVLWAIILHPVWYWNVREEERLMEEAFPHAYEKYARNTRRFVPIKLFHLTYHPQGPKMVSEDKI